MQSSISPLAKVYRISISSELGQKKKNISKARLISMKGIEGDAHSETERPLSLLPFESFTKLKHPGLAIFPGDFAENITTIGLNFRNIQVGTKLNLGKSATIEIIQIGKVCHNRCVIRELAGDCIMPDEGVFARVIVGDELCEGDQIKILE
jgi:MOSC domain-containing protein YiiM